MSLKTQLSLAGGEISPSLYGHTDLAKYLTGLRTQRNLFTMRFGGAASRAGSGFLGHTKKGVAFTTRLIPFVFNDAQTYMLEFGDLYMRVYKDGVVQTKTGQAVTNITNANPAVLSYSGADTYANGDQVIITGVAGALGKFINGREFTVAGVNTGANTFQLADHHGTLLNSTTWGAYTSGGTVSEIYELVTPFAFTQVAGLKYTQSADVMTLVNAGAPQELVRVADNSWTIGAVTLGPSIAAPTGFGAGGTASGPALVTAVSASGEESLPSNSDDYGATGTAWLFTWDLNIRAIAYNLYDKSNGSFFAFVRTLAHPVGIDPATITVAATDYSRQPPTIVTPFTASGAFAAAGDQPSVAGYYQQRLLLGGTVNDPESLFASFVGGFKNFRPSGRGLDSDALAFTVAGLKVNPLLWVMDLGKLLLFTRSGAHFVDGDANGVMTPTAINLRKVPGSSGSVDYLRPLEVDGSALYVQSRGQIVRDLQPIEVQGYHGTDLSIFASHLFVNNTFLDWCYQEIPHSIVWGAMEDGTICALTYLREHQLFAWHRHDTSGFWRNIAAIPEGEEDSVYVIVDRIIGGVAERMIERWNTRKIQEPWPVDPPDFDSTIGDIRDFNALDSSLSYDGRNQTPADTMNISNLALPILGVTQANPGVVSYAGLDPTSGDTVTLSGITGMTELNGRTVMLGNVDAAADTFELRDPTTGDPIDTSSFTAYSAGGSCLQEWTSNNALPVILSNAANPLHFVPADVGNEIQHVDAAGRVIRLRIIRYENPNEVMARPNRTVDASHQIESGVWAKAVDEFNGLWHLEGRQVAVFADGFVVANPNNDTYPVLTVANGTVTLPRPYAVVHIGLPYFCDLETLDLNETGQEMEDKNKLISQVTVQVEKSRGIWAGTEPATDASPKLGLDEAQLREDENYDDPVALTTGPVEIKTQAKWSRNGRVFLRQIDPLPMTILSISPTGLIPRKGG